MNNAIIFKEEEFCNRNGGQALEGGAQGGGRVPTPGGVQGIPGHATEGSGLVTRWGLVRG